MVLRKKTPKISQEKFCNIFPLQLDFVPASLYHKTIKLSKSVDKNRPISEKGRNIMGKFVIRKVKTGTMFNLKAGNGEVIATSEVYNSMESCKNGIASVQKNAPIAAVENQTVEGYATEKHPKFEIYNDKAGEFRFRLKATNGQIIAVSEGYKALTGCMNGVESVKKNAVDAKIVEEA